MYMKIIALYMLSQNCFQAIVVFNETHLLYACAYHTGLKHIQNLFTLYIHVFLKKLCLLTFITNHSAVTIR